MKISLMQNPLKHSGVRGVERGMYVYRKSDKEHNCVTSG